MKEGIEKEMGEGGNRVRKMDRGRRKKSKRKGKCKEGKIVKRNVRVRGKNNKKKGRGGGKTIREKGKVEEEIKREVRQLGHVI